MPKVLSNLLLQLHCARLQWRLHYIGLAQFLLCTDRVHMQLHSLNPMRPNGTITSYIKWENSMSTPNRLPLTTVAALLHPLFSQQFVLSHACALYQCIDMELANAARAWQSQ